MITQEQVQNLALEGLRMRTIALDDGIVADPESSGPNVRWHQVALEGEWSGHWQGPFRLDSRDFEQMAFHFRSLENDTVVDYEHNSLNFFAAKNPAAGWIKDLQLRDTDQGIGLFARIEWTSSAADAIRTREYRYLSPTILWRTKDRKTGADLGTSLHSVALTNTPFLDELPEVRLNSSWLACLMPGTEPTEDDAMEKNQLTAMSAVLGLSADASFDSVLEHVRQLMADAKGVERVCGALGLEGASIDSMVATAQGLRDENENLRTKAAEADELRANALVRKARDEGKITKDNEAWVIKLAQTNPQMFSEWSATAPRVVPVAPKVPASRAAANVPLSKSDENIAAAVAAMDDNDRKTARMMGMSPESYAKYNLAELLG